MLEGPQVESSSWQRELSRLETEHGVEVYRHLFYVIGHLDLDPERAKFYWEGVHSAWVELASQSRCPIDVRLALLGYLLQQRNELRSPTVVEIDLLQKAVEFALRDDLTGLYNYRYFRERSKEEMTRAVRYSSPLSLLMIDVDNFKPFNDRFGHRAGNAALQQLAAVLARSVRVTDVVSRYGGEEFALLLPATPRAGAMTVAEKIRENVQAEKISGAAGAAPLTVSIGVAAFPGDARSTEELIERADRALYLAKAAGKNCTRVGSNERRETPRYPAHLEGRLCLLGDDRLPVVTKDVSQGGLSFDITQKLSVGNVVQLELSLPERLGLVECTCRVVRVHKAGEAYSVGTQIIHIEPHHTHPFRRLLDGLANLPDLTRESASLS